MKILVVHERFGSLAGAEANAVITGSSLRQRGHQVAMIHGPGTGKKEEEWRQVFDPRFSLEGNGGRETGRRALAEFQPDVIYVHKMANLDLLEELRDAGIPLVRMVHDHDIYCMRSYKYNYFTREVCHRPAGWHCVFPCGAVLVRNREGGLPLKWNSYREKRREIQLNRRFDRHVVVTRYMKEELLRNDFEEERIRILPPIPKMGDPSLESNYSDRNLIVYAGQIIRGKGVDVLLRALARLEVPFECIILGEGGHRAACERLSKKLGLADRVHFKGFVPQEELKSYYRECSAFAISSVWPEPIATVGLEVMRFGLPVVAFDAGGISDWLEDGKNGYLVPWMDVDAYARRLEDLLKNKELARRMGENGRRIATERYDFDRYIQDLEMLFREVSEAELVEGKH